MTTAAVIAMNTRENILVVSQKLQILADINVHMFRALTVKFNPPTHNSLMHFMKYAVSFQVLNLLFP